MVLVVVRLKTEPSSLCSAFLTIHMLCMYIMFYVLQGTCGRGASYVWLSKQMAQVVLSFIGCYVWQIDPKTMYQRVSNHFTCIVSVQYVSIKFLLKTLILGVKLGLRLLFLAFLHPWGGLVTTPTRSFSPGQPVWVLLVSSALTLARFPDLYKYIFSPLFHPFYHSSSNLLLPLTFPSTSRHFSLPFSSFQSLRSLWF